MNTRKRTARRSPFRSAAASPKITSADDMPNSARPACPRYVTMPACSAIAVSSRQATPAAGNIRGNAGRHRPAIAATAMPRTELQIVGGPDEAGQQIAGRPRQIQRTRAGVPAMKHAHTANAPTPALRFQDHDCEGRVEQHLMFQRPSDAEGRLDMLGQQQQRHHDAARADVAQRIDAHPPQAQDDAGCDPIDRIDAHQPLAHVQRHQGRSVQIVAVRGCDDEPAQHEEEIDAGVADTQDPRKGITEHWYRHGTRPRPGPPPRGQPGLRPASAVAPS